MPIPNELGGAKMKKNFLFIFLGVFMIFIFTTKEGYASGYDYKNGDFVNINGYIFRVIDAEKNYLILSDVLENRAFDFEKNTNNDYNPLRETNVGYYLNTVFLNNLSVFGDYIQEVTWMGKNNVNAKIGMISEKEVGIYPRNLFERSSSYFWTITPNGTSWVKVVRYDGTIGNEVSTRETIGVRPTLFLTNGLYIIDGDGTITSPYILSNSYEYLSEISNLSLISSTSSEISLVWENPKSDRFSHVEIYQDGTLKEANFKAEIYTFNNLVADKEYQFTFVVVDDKGMKTNGKSIKISTKDVPATTEVINLKATAKHNRVNLSWENPKNAFFNHVIIYRKKIEEKTVVKKVNEFLLGSPVYAESSENMEPLFETNGTYFNDLSVKPSTTYDYKVTTMNIGDVESEGVMIRTTTEAEPPPQIEGIGSEKDENGDFLYTWTSPTTGQVKVLIDGKEFKTVNASLKQILIPAADMKYDIFNNPKVQLVPISEDGKEGVPSVPKPGSGTGDGIEVAELPFSVKDVIESGVLLLKLVAAFVLAALAFIFARKIMIMILKAFGYEVPIKKRKVEVRKTTRRSNERQRKRRTENKSELTRTKKTEVEKKERISRKEERQSSYVDRTEEKKVEEMLNKRKKRMQQESNYKSYTARKKLGKTERQPRESREPRKRTERAVREERIPRQRRGV